MNSLKSINKNAPTYSAVIYLFLLITFIFRDIYDTLGIYNAYLEGGASTIFIAVLQPAAVSMILYFLAQMISYAFAASSKHAPCESGLFVIDKKTFYRHLGLAVIFANIVIGAFNLLQIFYPMYGRVVNIVVPPVIMTAAALVLYGFLSRIVQPQHRKRLFVVLIPTLIIMILIGI